MSGLTNFVTMCVLFHVKENYMCYYYLLNIHWYIKLLQMCKFMCFINDMVFSLKYSEALNWMMMA